MRLSDYHVHDMYEMERYFIDRGIHVMRVYNYDRNWYEFTLSKGDARRMYIFFYPLTDNDEERRREMSRFCEGVYKNFDENYVNKVNTGFNAKSFYPKAMPVPRTLAPIKVHFSGPCTIVIWNDGTKTLVRCSEDDIYDTETGLAIAFCKKMFGNDNTFKKHFKKWLPEASESVQFAKLGEHVSEGLHSGIADVRADEFADRLAKSIRESLNGLGVGCRDQKRD